MEFDQSAQWQRWDQRLPGPLDLLVNRRRLNREVLSSVDRRKYALIGPPPCPTMTDDLLNSKRRSSLSYTIRSWSVQEEFSLAVQIRPKKVKGGLSKPCTPTKVHSEGHLCAWNTPSGIPHIPQLCADISLQTSDVGKAFQTTRLTCIHVLSVCLRFLYFTPVHSVI